MRNAEREVAQPPGSEHAAIGAVILAGGHSRRMGCDKAELKLGAETFLQRICRTLGGHFLPQVIVCRADQQARFEQLFRAAPPGRGPQVIIDRQPERGPLEGLATGLEFLAGQAVPRTVVTTCDAPLIQPALLGWLAIQLSPAERAVIPSDGQHLYGLTAAYDTTLGSAIRSLLEQGERRVIDLPRHFAARIVSREECRAVDPRLISFLNANTPEEYRSLYELAAAEA